MSIAATAKSYSVRADVLEADGGYYVRLGCDGHELHRFGPLRDRAIAEELMHAMATGARKSVEAFIVAGGGTVKSVRDRTA